MNLSTTSKPINRPYLSLSAGSISKKSTPLSQSKLSKELLDRIDNIASIKMGKLFHFIVAHRTELSIFAIKSPSKWLLFSQCMLQKFNTDCRIARLLKKLNHFVKDLDRAQCNKGIQNNFIDGPFNQVFPKELRQQIAIIIPPTCVDTSATLEKMRLILLEDSPLPNDCFSQIKSIPVGDLVYWINTYQIPLQTLKIASEKLNLLLPKLEYIDVSDFSEEKISVMLTKLKKVRHLKCNNMTDEGLEDLTSLNNLANLKSLDLSFCDKITDEGRQILQDLMPHVVIQYQQPEYERAI